MIVQLLGWLRKCVRTYFLCSDCIHNVYCGGLFGRHYVDAGYSHTVIWIYIFVVSGSESVTTSLIIIASFVFLSQSFHYCWVFVVSAALEWGPSYRCLKIKIVSAEGILNRWVCTLGWGGLAGCAHFIFCDWLLDPSKCLRPPLCRCFSDCNSSFYSSSFCLYTLKVLQTNTNFLLIGHRYCSVFFFFCYADWNNKKIYPDQYGSDAFSMSSCNRCVCEE